MKLFASVIISIFMTFTPIQTNINELEATVISNNNGIVQFQTEDGNGWNIENSNIDYVKNDKYIIVFDDMGTIDIYDDEIIEIKEV